MFIVLDKNKMEVQVICGILEKYEPGSDIHEISQKVSELKGIMEDFMEKTVEPRLMEINKKIAEENQKHTVESQS